MRKMYYLFILLLSAMTLLSACESERMVNVPLAAPAVNDDPKYEDTTPAPSTNLVVKSTETKTEAKGPMLDVSIDSAISRDSVGGSSAINSPPYRYPILGGSGSGGGRTTEESLLALDMEMFVHWSHMAVDASGFDHSLPTNVFTTMGVREQMGPGRSSRAMAMVHIAMFEVINAIKDGGYESYVDLPPVTEQTSVRAAVATSAYDTLTELFPSQEASFAYQKALDLQTIPDSPAKQRGIELGHHAAQLIIALRENDGSAHAEPVIDVDYFPSNDPGVWRKDPISQIPLALGANWHTVAPFVMTSSSQFRAPAPPALTSVEYATAFNEVKSLGGDGVTTPTSRTQDQTDIGIFWAYDGVPNLCAPPRLYNQIVMQIAEEKGTDLMNTARLLALANVAMSDATLGVWESKYYYDVWRPVTGIREADPGTGPSLLGDNNPLTTGDTAFSPLGAPASNIPEGINFTPPFPAYPSGHAGMGGAVFQILRKFYGTDNIAFTFVSDEMNGITKDNQGNVRPHKPRSFTSLSQAEEENGQSRIYLGIHWAFDKTGGITLGNQIADYVFDHLFVPVE